MSYFPNLFRAEVSTGLGAMEMKDVRTWCGKIISTSTGDWSVNYASSGFKQVEHIIATAQADVTEVARMPFTTIRTYSSTSASGSVLVPTSQMFLLGGNFSGMKKSTTPTTVFVQVIGY